MDNLLLLQTQQTRQLLKFNDEIKQYLTLRKKLEQSLKEKGAGEFFVVSKKWMFKWKEYINMDQLLHSSLQIDEHNPPDAINVDLQVQVPRDKTFQYFPDNHPWNFWIQSFNEIWEYEQLNHDIYQFFASRYKSCGAIIRRGIYDEKTTTREINVNLLKVQLIYQEKTGQYVTKYVQVDTNFLVVEWLRLLNTSFKTHFLNQGLPIVDLKLWLNVDLTEQEFVNRLSSNNQHQIDATLLHPDRLIGSYGIKDYSPIFVEFLSESEWIYSQIDSKTQHKQTLKDTFQKASDGCGREVCTFQYCANNPEMRSQKLNKNQLAAVCLKGLQQNPNLGKSICSPILSITSSLHAKELDEAFHITEPQSNAESFLKRLGQVFMERDALNLSFLQGVFQLPHEIYNEKMVTPQDPKVDIPSLQSINQYLIEFKLQQYQPQKAQILCALNKSFPLKQKDLGIFITNQMDDNWDLRGIFILLQFYFIFEEDILQDLFGLLNTIRTLSGEQKSTLAKWLTLVSEQHMQYCVDQIQQQLTLQLLQDDIYQLSCPVAALKITCIIELLELFQKYVFITITHRSNIIFPRIGTHSFINNQAENLYLTHQHQEEYLQFRSYIQRDYRDFTWTFCRWSWLLSTEFKNKILAVESKVEQSQRVQRFHRQLQINPYELMQNGDFSPHLVIKVKRDDMIGSTLLKLSQSGHQLKMPLKVHFEGEQGVDEGGVKREYFSLLTQQLFTPNYGMFVSKNNDMVLWFNGQSQGARIQYELMGKLLGLALYNQVLLDIKFPSVVFKKLQKEAVNLDDLKYLDPDTHKSLMNLRQYESMDIEDSFCLNFSIQFEVWGETFTTEFKKNGQSIPVTQQNKEEYINLYVDWYLNTSIEKQFALFYEGFKKVVDGEVIKVSMLQYVQKLFTGEELSSLIMGSPIFDIAELASVTIYENGFHDKHPFIKDLWELIFSLPLEQQKQFLFYVTGSDRVPIGGLKTMKFIIQKNGNDSELLPTAHTCFNVLLLPQYANKEKLREKILKALNNVEGFGLF